MASKAQAAPTAWVFLTPSPFPFLEASQQNSSFWRLELGWLVWGSTGWCLILWMPEDGLCVFSQTPPNRSIWV